MAIRKLIALGVTVAAGYCLYRYFLAEQYELTPQWANEPGPLIEDDPVDEASWESFPASDPPSFNVSRSRS